MYMSFVISIASWIILLCAGIYAEIAFRKNVVFK